MAPDAIERPPAPAEHGPAARGHRPGPRLRHRRLLEQRHGHAAGHPAPPGASAQSSVAGAGPASQHPRSPPRGGAIASARPGTASGPPAEPGSGGHRSPAPTPAVSTPARERRCRPSSSTPAGATTCRRSRWRSCSPTAAAGWASRAIASARPLQAADGQTVFAIASITKTFVTAVIMQLVDEGRLSLGRSPRPLAAAFPHARTHHHPRAAGPHERRLQLLREPALPASWCSRDRRIAGRSARSRTSCGARTAPPGGCYHYSNTNFVVLGRVAELVTGKSIAELDPQAAARSVRAAPHVLPARREDAVRRGARLPGATRTGPAEARCCP